MSDKQLHARPNARPTPLAAVAPVVFSLLIGGVAGYFIRSASAVPYSAPAAAPGGAANAGRPGGMRGGGMGGGMGGGQASSTSALPRLVRNLATIEKVQNAGLDPGQAKRLLPILTQLQSADKLPEQECTAKMAAMEGILSGEQKQALQSLQPARGGGMGGMRGGGPGGMRGGGMGGMGGGQDPERPFASERNKQALADLIASLQGPQKQ